MASRLERVRAALAERHLMALLVSKAENILYLSGFSGGADGMLLITPDSHYLISDFRYQLQAEREAAEWPFVRAEGSLLATVRGLLDGLGAPEIGIEADALTVTQYRALGGDAPEAAYSLLPAGGIVETLRLVKDPTELAAIRKAAQLVDDAYLHLLAKVAVGVTERVLALEAEWYMRQHGAQGVSFDLIVAGGPNSALPHAQPTDRPLRAGDLVVCDMGARVGHYCSDMTRTFAVKKASATAREIYQVCLEAQLAGLRGLHGGMTGDAADSLVRDVIDVAGYGAQFGHGTGHGVGLAVHESPRLRPGAEEMLPVGAVVTVEPGIYLPKQGGVRIEDLVVLTATGVENYTTAPKPAELPIYG